MNGKAWLDQTPNPALMKKPTLRAEQQFSVKVT